MEASGASVVGGLFRGEMYQLKIHNEKNLESSLGILPIVTRG